MCAYVKFSINCNFNVNCIKVVHKIREHTSLAEETTWFNFHHVLPGSPTNAINIHFQLAQKYSGI